MRRTLFLATAILSVACNRSAQQTPASTPGPAEASTARNTANTVKLVGCLKGPDQPATGAPATDAISTHGAAATARYVLTDVAIEAGGTGANGAGASDGPLLSPGTSVLLDGVPADAQNSVNKQVRVVGRIDARPAGAAADVPGTTTGTTGSVSPRDDVRANSTAVAGAAPESANRHVTVERVETVAQTCHAR